MACTEMFVTGGGIIVNRASVIRYFLFLLFIKFPIELLTGAAKPKEIFNLRDRLADRDGTSPEGIGYFLHRIFRDPPLRAGHHTSQRHPFCGSLPDHIVENLGR
jgi:hypothetical protein